MMKWTIFLLVVLASLLACQQQKSGVAGKILFQDQALAGAQVEFFLKQGTERSSRPFSVVTTDQQGNFQALLPSGSYYLVARKKEQGAGVNRMLMAEYPANPVLVKQGQARITPLRLIEVGTRGEIVADGVTGVSGRVTFEGKPQPGTFIYVYPHAEELNGPSYRKVVQADAGGNFVLDLRPGTFWLVARWRQNGARVGALQVGDLKANWQGNPLLLKPGERRSLADWPLQKFAHAALLKRQQQGSFTRTDTSLRAQMVDADNNPLQGIYLFAYRDSRMIGKPDFISAPSTADGQTEVFVDQGGEYFVGARSAFGGPLEPGEWVGTYDQQVDHGVQVAEKEHLDLGQIQAREVW